MLEKLEIYRKLAVLPRRFKVYIMLGADVVLLPLALYSAIILRLGTWTPDVSAYSWVFFVLPFVTVPIFIRVGLYRAVIRYMDDKIISTVFYGVSLSVLALIGVVVLGRLDNLPRSSIAIYWITAIAYISSSRFLARGILRGLEVRQDSRVKVAIYGAGRSGLQTALALLSGTEFRPIAFFDDSKDLQGSNLAGIRVYDPHDAMEILMEHDCRQLLIAMPSASRARRREIIQQFEGKDLTLKTLPGFGELVDGKVRVEDIREVGVEDLLGRDPVSPDRELIDRCIRNKSVLVTGAGGSIGSELCRQIAQNHPSALILFEHNEYGLYRLEQELQRQFPHTKIFFILGDVLDKSAFSSVLREYNVDTVYHSAAYKHVPLVEKNIVAGVRNNVFGTLRVAEACIQENVKNFVLISTDKAVRPSNIMGVTKRLAELVLQALSRKESNVTRFTMVRFGNVLGSSGSVVPLFKDQIRLGGPVTVTHADVTRYFMTIPEAAQLVLQAGSMGQGGDVFVLDMGEPVKIADLARRMIELSGFEVKNSIDNSGDIAIEYIGLRPGEKLYEELLIGENVEKTPHPRIMRAFESWIEPEDLFPKLIELENLCATDQVQKVQNILKEIVKEYNPYREN